MPAQAWKNRNLFEDVLHREDALTDALRNFLKYPTVQEVLWKTLPNNVQEKVRRFPIKDIQTRPSDGHSGGRPDLVLYGSNFVLVIEVKLWAPLTEIQRETTYFKWLNDEISGSRRGILVFLVPDDYPEEPLNSCLDKTKERCRSENPNILILNRITWGQFVKAFGSQEILSFNELIREFYSHLSERFVQKPIIFSKEEKSMMHSKDTAKGICQLMEIVEGVKTKSKSMKCSDFRIKNLSAYSYGYDFHSPEQNKSIWFGIWPGYWYQEDKDSPLCLCIYTDPKYNSQSILDSFRTYYGNKVKDFDDAGEKCLVVGFPLPEPGEDCNELIGEIANDIQNLLREDGSGSEEGAS